jgi:hypothetical protein
MHSVRRQSFFLQVVMAMARDTRLRFHLQPEGALWYHLEAANSHLLIDPQVAERARAPGFARPIELWRAPRWKHPPGLNVVRYPGADDAPNGRTRAEPDGDEPPGPGDVVNRTSVVDFVSDVSTFRLGALGALIDAVAAALDGAGPPVVLAAPDADQGALWIGAVSFFAAPQICLRLSFSTHERWDDVLAQLLQDGPGSGPGNRESWEIAGQEGRGGEVKGWRQPVLSVVPESDLDSLTRDDDLPVVVIDPRVEPTLGRAGEVEYRRTHLGQQIVVTDWSRWALAACGEDYAALERTLEGLDDTGPAEPVRATEAGPGPAWDRLQAALADGPARAAVIRAAFETYLRLALDDEAWLLRQAPPLPPEMGSSAMTDPGLADRLRIPLLRLVHRLTGDLPTGSGAGVDPSEPGQADENQADDDLAGDVRRGVQLLRGVDLAHRISRLVGGPDLVATGIGRLAERAVEVLLDPTAGPRVAEIAGALDGEALARWIVPLLARDTALWPFPGHPAGERLPAPVIALLAGAIDPLPLIEADRADPLSGEPVALEVAVATATGRIAGDPRLRGVAVEHLLHQAARIYPDADPGPMVTEVFARLAPDERWSAAALSRLVERAPAALGPELVPIVLQHLPEWADDPHGGRLAAALLKRIEFLPRLGGDGRPRPRRAGVTDAQAQQLNLLAAGGADRYLRDDGLDRQAAEILMWGERIWDGADPEIRQVIAPRITVAAFQVALAAEPDLAGTALGVRLAAVPLGSSWRSAVTTGLESALPMLVEMLRLNRYRLTGELVVATTRGLLNPLPDLVIDARGELVPDRPRVTLLPVRLVLHWLIRHENRPELQDHLAALVEQELHAHVGPGNRTAVIAYWKPALLDVPFRVSGPTGPPLPPTMLDEVLQVAFGFRDRAGRPLRPGSLAGLLPWPGRQPPAERPAGSDSDSGSEPGSRSEPGPAGPRSRSLRWPRRR